MQTITDYKYIANAMIAIRAKKEGFITNFFLGEEKCNLLIKNDLLYGVTYEKCGLIFHKDHDFYHVYFMTTHVEPLNHALKQLNQDYAGNKFVVDIVGNPPMIEPLSQLFEQRGFKKYVSLYRMSRTKNIDEPQELDARIEYATLNHAEQIHDLLEAYFDKYSEQIPIKDEIEQWIADNSVLIIRENEKIIGFVIFEIQGLTAYLRYWFTHPDYRNKKVGSALLRRFFHECRHTKRQLFWVISSNENAIARYQHYGFQAEQLSDLIMIKK
jgi:ribosomal protein S18 acetylase RimI-like enzyme